MAVEIYIPKMSDHMEEATLVEWLVVDGEAVEKGQPILVVETDKAVAEVEAPASGILTGVRPGFEDGATIAIGVTVAFIVGDLADPVPVLEPHDEPVAGSEPAVTPEPTQAVDPRDLPTDSPSSGWPVGGPVRATPAARKAARELDIDLVGVPGSGPSGRISESDVRNQASAVSVEASDREVGNGDDRWLSLTAVQSVTAQRMAESAATVPQFSLVRHLDMTAVREARQRYGADAPSKPSVTAYLVKAVALALGSHPRVNGFFRDDRIEINDDINVGVALGTEEGLFVPVIHNADRLSITEIADSLTRLRRLADGQGFAPGDLEGGTFTLSNLGMFGVDEFRALVNPPQAAILATGKMSKAVVVDADGAMRIRDRMTATISADHRSLDGTVAALFLSSISDLLEEADQDSGRAR